MWIGACVFGPAPWGDWSGAPGFGKPSGLGLPLTPRSVLVIFTTLIEVPSSEASLATPLWGSWAVFTPVQTLVYSNVLTATCCDFLAHLKALGPREGHQQSTQTA